MNKYYILSVFCFIFGAVLMGLGISHGEGTIYWALIIPVFTGTGWPFTVGSLLLIVGFITLFIGFISGSYELVDFDEDEWFGYEREPYQRPQQRKRLKSKSGVQRKTQKEYENARNGSHRPADYRGSEHMPPDYRSRAPQRPRTRVKTGGVIFIGPIPIIWGSDKKIGYIMALVAVVLVIVFLIFTLTWFF